jgi:dihydrofolate synthase/folylpolyglutamate synthase
MSKMAENSAQIRFNEIVENRMMAFLHKHYGMEIFTPGLDRTRILYVDFIEQLQKRGTKVITIAGTNGKGQTAHTLAAFLKSSQKNFALWTSPHILSLTERFQFSESGIDKAVSAEMLEQTLISSHEEVRNRFPDLKISFYEFLFYVFLKMANETSSLDFLLLEVGLGGKLDAVNHFDADCSCITSISRDHQAILGNTYRSILSEKIAVSRRGKPLFTNFSLEYLNSLTKKYCEENGVNWISLKLNQDEDYFHSNQKMAWEIFNYFLPENSLSFEKMLEVVPLFKGRREIMTFGTKSLIFIGAHNIDGIRKMMDAQKMVTDDSIDSVVVSFSKRPVAEVEIMLKGLMDFFDSSKVVKVCCFDHPKAMACNEVAQALTKVNKGMFEFVSDWKADLHKSKAEKILFCGSYYFIGEVQRFILSTSN